MAEQTLEVEAFWKQLGLDDPYDVWSFGDSPELADALLALVLEGKKTATCGALVEMGTESSPAPVLGGYSVILDSAGAPRAVLQTIALTTMPFSAVPEDFALAEGEGTFEQWRLAHQAYFERRCAALGKEPSPDMPVVCERFRVVFPPQPE